ncbi:MAG TPA: winged helix-turn-helix domain-containing protein [Bryobacteraceae bacterium]|nr:winged helix-turn-helix domain-containing protein [Bryobacteraceae bacterium]
MSAPRPHLTAYRFGPFRLSVSDRILERDGQRVHLTPKVIDTLFVLVENSRQVVTKEELMRAVWPDVNVVESGLTRNISALRKALEEGVEEGSFVETIPRRGYRFRPEIREELEAPEPEPVPTAVVDVEPPRDRRSWRIWAGLSAAVFLAGLLATVTYRGAQPVRSSSAVEPSVRIGEHLLYKLAPEQTVRASEHFENAIAQNPQSPGAHAGLAISLLHLAAFGVRPLAEVLPSAEAAAKRSLELDGNSGPAHYATAMILLVKDWNFRAAEAEFQKSLELQRESVQARLGYSRLKIAIGDLDGARRLAEEALRLDPASPPLGTEYCRVFYFGRDFRRAESECRKVLEREPGYALAHYYLALSLGYLGRNSEANQALDRSGLMPGVVEADRAWIRLRAGDRTAAEQVLADRLDRVRRGEVDGTATLLPAAMVGDMDEAYRAIQAGLHLHAPELLTLHLEPRLEPVRRDARYAEVARRIGTDGP